MRGVFTCWLLLAMSTFGLLFPHLAARDFLEDASVVRWMAVPLFLFSAFMLADYYNIVRISV